MSKDKENQGKAWVSISIPREMHEKLEEVVSFPSVRMRGLTNVSQAVKHALGNFIEKEIKWKQTLENPDRFD